MKHLKGEFQQQKTAVGYTFCIRADDDFVVLLTLLSDLLPPFSGLK
jgi:hypothetical protein